MLEQDDFVYDSDTEIIVGYAGTKINFIVSQVLITDNTNYPVKHIGDDVFPPARLVILNRCYFAERLVNYLRKSRRVECRIESCSQQHSGCSCLAGYAAQ